ncbi:claudin domain-containing protein 2 [Ctenodactylus gundi]
MGLKRSLQSGGAVLSSLANVLTVLSTATNYWIHDQGGHSGLWQTCTKGQCSNMPCQTAIATTAACMVLATVICFVATVMAVRVLRHEDESLRGQNTSVFLFVSGLLLLTGLTCYTVKNAWSDGAFSWSYFSGWLALPFTILAGCCFLLADMILQSTEAISGFPVCL